MFRKPLTQWPGDLGNALNGPPRTQDRYSRRWQRVLVEVDPTATVRVVDHGQGADLRIEPGVLEPFACRQQDREAPDLGSLSLRRYWRFTTTPSQSKALLAVERPSCWSSPL